MATIVKNSAAAKSLWNGQTLHISLWEPARDPTSLLFISHGVCEHMGRYDALATALAEEGILVFGHDHVGHGKSEGDRAHIEDYGQYVQDVIQTIQQTKTRFPDLPCYLMGHSMGGLIAGLTAIEKQDWFKGLILSAALCEIDPKVASWFIQTLAKVVAFVTPQLGMKKLNLDDISSIPEEVKIYAEDELVYHGAMKAKWASASIAATAKLRDEISKIQLPLLIIHGTNDNLVPITSSEFIAANVTSTNVRFEKFDSCRHEVFHDKDRDKAIAAIKDWILNL